MMRRLRLKSPEMTVMILVAVGISLLIVVPNALVLVRGFLDRNTSVLSLANFAELLQEPEFYPALKNTLISALLASILATFMGVSLAWIVTRTDTPFRRGFQMLNLIPFFLSPFVGALAWSILGAKTGLINRVLMPMLGLDAPLVNIASLGGLIWVLALFYTPYVYLFTVGPLGSMDPSLEEAARAHGASPLQTTIKVTLPLLTPAILSAFLIAFVTSAEVFDIPMALTQPVGIPTLPTEIYRALQFPPNYNQAAAISTVLILITLLGVWAQRKIQGTRSYATVTGKGYRPSRIALGKWRWATALFAGLYALAAVVLPLTGLFLVATSKVWTGTFKAQLFTWDNFHYVLFSYDLTKRSLQNSLILAVAGATIGVLLAFLVGYLIHRTKWPWRATLELISSIPTGIPGLVLALGFLLVLIRTPLYGTLWIILIANVTRFFPYGERNVSAMLQSVGPELEQSARVHGANWFQAVGRVTLPLVKPGMLAAWMMLFVIFIRELSTSVLLYQNGTETMSVAMMIISQRNQVYTAAFALIQTLILLIAGAGFVFIGNRKEGIQL